MRKEPARIEPAPFACPSEITGQFPIFEKALLWLVRECKAAGIEGFYTCTQGGEMKFYCNWEGAFDDLTRFTDYPGQIVNTPNNLNGTPFTLEDGIRLFGRPVLGGFDRKGKINTASEAEVADMARAILDSNPKGRVMVGADCTVSSAPLANIGAAVAAAHGVRR